MEAQRAMRSVLEAKDRTRAGATVPACGLFLWNVEYGDRIHGNPKKHGAENSPASPASIEDRCMGAIDKGFNEAIAQNEIFKNEIIRNR